MEDNVSAGSNRMDFSYCVAIVFASHVHTEHTAILIYFAHWD